MLTPVMSPGSRSGVNWMRLLVPCDALGHRARERRLARAGEVLEQQVALAEQRGEAQADDEGLAEQHLLDVGDETSERLVEECSPARASSSWGVLSGWPGQWGASAQVKVRVKVVPFALTVTTRSA